MGSGVTGVENDEGAAPSLGCGAFVMGGAIRSVTQTVVAVRSVAVVAPVGGALVDDTVDTVADDVALARATTLGCAVGADTLRADVLLSLIHI